MKLTRRNLFGAMAGTVTAVAGKPQAPEKPAPARFGYEDRNVLPYEQRCGHEMGTIFRAINFQDVTSIKTSSISRYKLAVSTKCGDVSDSSLARCVVVTSHPNGIPNRGPAMTDTLYGRQAQEFLDAYKAFRGENP